MHIFKKRKEKRKKNTDERYNKETKRATHKILINDRKE